MSAPSAYIQELAMKIGSIKDIYDQHLKEYDELLPHVFLGDLTRYIVHRVRSILSGEHGIEGRSEIEIIMQHFEKGMTSGTVEIQELIAVSFLENLNQSDKKLLKKKLGPNLLKELNSINNALHG